MYACKHLCRYVSLPIAISIALSSVIYLSIDASICVFGAAVPGCFGTAAMDQPHTTSNQQMRGASPEVPEVPPLWATESKKDANIDPESVCRRGTMIASIEVRSSAGAPAGRALARKTNAADH